MSGWGHPLNRLWGRRIPDEQLVTASLFRTLTVKTGSYSRDPADCKGKSCTSPAGTGSTVAMDESHRGSVTYPASVLNT